MDEIKLNISKAEESINSYSDSIDRIKKIYKRLKNENMALRSRWNGTSADAFAKYSEIIEKNLLGRINELEKLCNSLNEAKDTFIEEDNNILKEYVAGGR